MPCALCLKPIDEKNDSREHIIPNAIGGRLKVSSVLCSSCNSGAGQRWDSDLAAQLNPLALLISIVRERGESPSQVLSTVSGKKFLYRTDRTLAPAAPTFQAIQSEDGSTKISIAARSMEEARSMMKGMRRKYPGIDVDSVLSSAKLDRSFLDEFLDIPSEFGGPFAGRSLVKTALCFAVSHGVPPLDCDTARRYLMDEQGEPCFGYFYSRDLLRPRPPGLPLHCVAVSNRGTDGQLLGYVEYFGVRRQVVCLSENYVGADMHCSYSVDPTTGKEIDLDFEIEFSRQEVDAVYDYQHAEPRCVTSAFEPVIERALKRSEEEVRDRLMQQALAHAWKNCGAKEGEVLSPSHIAKFSELVVEQLGPYIQQLSRRQRES